ncbi:MAG: glycosyltransferase family 39 protein, partial [Candidatus Binatia bacterium]
MTETRRAAPSRITGAILLCLSFAAGTAAVWLWHGRWRLLLPVWAATMAATVAGAALLGRVAPGAPAEAATTERSRRLRLGALAGCLAVALFFRLHRIGSVPPGIFVDETNSGLDALRILEGADVSPFGVGWFETPSLYAYYMATLFAAGGAGFAMLKLASLLPAALTVALLHPFARPLFGARAALLATLLLAVSRWHVTLSRWGWNELMPPLFQLLATGILLRALVTGRAAHFVLAGLALGLCMYTYLASRLVVAVIAAWVAWRAVFERGFFRRNAGGLLLFTLSYLLCFAPLLATYAKDPFTFLHRSQQVSILRDVERAGSWAPLLENAGRHLLMFHVAGDRNPRHNLPGRPMLPLPSGFLLLVGLAIALRQLPDLRFALLLLWIAITLQGGILSSLDEGPQAYRTLGVVPA